MELFYKGFLRRTSGSGRSFDEFEESITEDKIGNNIPTRVPDSFIRINEIKTDAVDFSFFFFNEESRFVVRRGENVSLKKEGSAFGFEISFSIIN